MFFFSRNVYFAFSLQKRGGKKKLLRSFFNEKRRIRMNKYIQRNALANEIITIKRFATFYVM